MQLSERPAGLVLPERESQNADPRFLETEDWNVWPARDNGGCDYAARNNFIRPSNIWSIFPSRDMLSAELPNIIGRNMTSFGIQAE